jgi:hypothetical protein
MAFAEYPTLGDAIQALRVTETEEEFIQPASFPVSDYFRTRLNFRMATWSVSRSETAVCEQLIYPVLEEVAVAYCDVLNLWSHVALYYEGKLLGTPDYVVAKRSSLSKEVLETPYAMIMEAKRNDFYWGWSQCLAAMRAAQTLNGTAERSVYGCVSDGRVWSFGKLQAHTFMRNRHDYSLTRLDELFAALNHMFQLCKEQVLAPAAAA